MCMLLGSSVFLSGSNMLQNPQQYLILGKGLINVNSTHQLQPVSVRPLENKKGDQDSLTKKRLRRTFYLLNIFFWYNPVGINIAVE